MSPDSCLSIHVYLRILCKIHVSGSLSQQPYVSQEPLQNPRLRIHVSASLYLTDSLQDPCLRIHVSASLYLRILCKIHVCGSMYPIHVLASTNMGPLQDPCLRIHVSASICISGSSARSMSPDPCLSILFSGSSERSMSLDTCLSIHMYLRSRCTIHVSGSGYKHPYVSQDPLQDPCLRFMSQHLYISGSSARFMSPDSCLSIFISQDPLQDPCLRIASICISGSSARSMSPGSCLSIFASQDPLQDPCLRIHVSASSYLRILCKIHVSDSCLGVHQNGSSARSMSPDSCLSIHMYLRILCKIHVSGSMSQHPFVSQDPLQDPRLRIHVSASLYPRILCKIHVSGSISQQLYLSGSSARSMSPNPSLSIFISQDPLQDPCLRIHVSDSCLSIHQYGSSARSMSPDPCLSIHMYLRILCKIHVSGSMSPIHVSASTYPDPLHDPCISIHVSASLSVDPLQDPYPSVHTCGSCAKSTRRALFVALRRENTPIEILFFDLPRRIFCGPAQAKRKF